MMLLLLLLLLLLVVVVLLLLQLMMMRSHGPERILSDVADGGGRALFLSGGRKVDSGAQTEEAATA